ncbi:DUF488 domain-containing protein [Frigidibacter sp. ROC022]|uniref:DUF488 domain-containing protein n=1 Tax=Frigidibacter sp. ROC022 TaxID=2971796 RepID=UPI00215AB5FB|nr:DUF488 domain-containing protein [Frigidibacter sp. ROC022]MCR8724744.1 DUF488 domain-containing protein [Frigidibacter sp. ROC022]
MFDTRSTDQGTNLMTIGYEGAVLADFIETLKLSGVRSLIDVRELPLSRKKGFSKTALRNAVEEAGIAYLHERQLGDPKPGRDAARSGDMETFSRIFHAHIQSPESREALKSLLPIVAMGGACLLCFERNHEYCHRNIVANELSKLARIELLHIGVSQGIAGRK